MKLVISFWYLDVSLLLLSLDGRGRVRVISNSPACSVGQTQYDQQLIAYNLTKEILYAKT